MDLSFLGLSAPDMLAGFCGGIVSAFIMKRTSPNALLGTVIVGTMVANYLGPVAAHVLGTPPWPSSFITGLAGIPICERLLDAARRWRPPIPPGFNGGSNSNTNSNGDAK